MFNISECECVRVCNVRKDTIKTNEKCIPRDVHGRIISCLYCVNESRVVIKTIPEIFFLNKTHIKSIR